MAGGKGGGAVICGVDRCTKAGEAKGGGGEAVVGAGAAMGICCCVSGAVLGERASAAAAKSLAGLQLPFRTWGNGVRERLSRQEAPPRP